MIKNHLLARLIWNLFFFSLFHSLNPIRIQHHLLVNKYLSLSLSRTISLFIHWFFFMTEAVQICSSIIPSSSRYFIPKTKFNTLWLFGLCLSLHSYLSAHLFVCVLHLKTKFNTHLLFGLCWVSVLYSTVLQVCIDTYAKEICNVYGGINAVVYVMW